MAIPATNGLEFHHTMYFRIPSICQIAFSAFNYEFLLLGAVKSVVTMPAEE
jgi:hypothetical protein